jgi:hypothetical protein
MLVVFRTGFARSLAAKKPSGKLRYAKIRSAVEFVVFLPNVSTSFNSRGKALIDEIINSKAQNGNMGMGGGGGMMGGMGPKPGFGMMSGGPSIELMVPSSKVGLIIGKGGETIRNLSDKHGVKMVTNFVHCPPVLA